MILRAGAFALSVALIFVIPWEGVVEIPVLGSGAKVVGLAAAVCWLASVAWSWKIRTPGAFHLLLLLFVLWTGVGVIWSADPKVTASEAAVWAQSLVMVYLLWDLFTTKAALATGLQAFVLGEYVAIVSAVYHYLAGNPFYTHYQRFTPSGQTNPDGFGLIVALGIPVAWYLATTNPFTRKKALLKAVNYAYVPAAFLGIALSGTRTALLCALVGSAYGLASLTQLRLRTRIQVIALLTSAVLVLMPFLRPLRSFERLGTTYSALSEGDLNQRSTIWREGLAAFPEHPLRGVGGKMFRSTNSLGKLAHNSFISVLVEHGMIGFTLFGLVLGVAGVGVIRLRRQDARFWLALMAVWAIGASTLSYESRKATWLIFSLAVASAAASGRRDEETPRNIPVSLGLKTWNTSHRPHVARVGDRFPIPGTRARQSSRGLWRPDT